MKPVNVLPILSSQDSDFKVKDGSEALIDSDKGSDFTRLVEYHTKPEKKASPKAEVSTTKEKNDTRSLADGKKGTSVDDVRQETDSLADDSSDTIKVDEGTEATQAIVDTAAPTKVTSAEDNEGKIIGNIADKEELNESEQFISLLYNSDQTLTDSTKRTSTVIDTANQQVSAVSDEDTELSAGNGKDKLNKLSSTSEQAHKLDPFSPEELLSRESLKSKKLNEQPSNDVLKAYQQSLVSQKNSDNTQNMDSETLVDTPSVDESAIPNKSNDLLASISQAVNNQDIDKSDLKQVDSELKTEKLNKKVTSDALKVVADIEQPNKMVDDGESKANLAVNTVDESHVVSTIQSTIKVSNKADTTVVNLSETDKLTTVSKVNKVEPAVDTATLVTEQKSIVMAENESLTKGASIIAEPKSNNGKIQVTQESQQKQTQVAQVNNIESQEVEELSDESVDPALFTELKPNETLSTKAVKATDSIAARPISDLHAQSIASTQAKQNDDAYVEFQSSEMLNHNIASDTAHIQKNNVQLQQETISMFRKDFSDAVKDKVMVMINQKIQQFEITLDPPEFGNMHVRVNLQGDQASVNFVVQNQQAKDSLEQNMHKLKDMLAEQGVDVGGANVDQQNQQDNNGEQNNEYNDGKNNGIHPVQPNSKRDEHKVEHILSANLFDSSPAGVDYYA